MEHPRDPIAQHCVRRQPIRFSSNVGVLMPLGVRMGYIAFRILADFMNVVLFLSAHRVPVRGLAHETQPQDNRDQQTDDKCPETKGGCHFGGIQVASPYTQKV
jgi:hypothetical protein